MYKEFYGFSEEPFPLNPNPKFLYLSPSHHEAMSSLMSGIKERKGIMVITGEAGVGKTTLIYALLKDLSEKIKTAFIFQTRLDFRDLLKNILRDLEVPIKEKEENILSFLLIFRRYLNERLSQGETVTIIIDEAQSLDDEVLRDLLRLSSPDPPATKSPQIVLVGHPELEVRLDFGKLRPLKEHAALHRVIRRLTREETRKYIQHRLKIVGADLSEVFTPEAVNRVWEFSEGIPRVINLVCDRALLNGYQASSPIIDSKIVNEAIEDFSYPQPRKSGIFRKVFSQVNFHYQIIGILVILLGSLGIFSLFPPDFSLSILKGMTNLLPSVERPMGIGGNILPSEEQPIKIKVKGKIPLSKNRSAEKEEEEITEMKKSSSLSLASKDVSQATSLRTEETQPAISSRQTPTNPPSRAQAPVEMTTPKREEISPPRSIPPPKTQLAASPSVQEGTPILPTAEPRARVLGYEPIFFITQKNTPLRQEPSNQSKIIETLKKGRKVEKIGESGKWVKVKIWETTIGWTTKDLLQEIG